MGHGSWLMFDDTRMSQHTACVIGTLSEGCREWAMTIEVGRTKVGLALPKPSMGECIFLTQELRSLENEAHNSWGADHLYCLVVFLE